MRDISLNRIRSRLNDVIDTADAMMNRLDKDPKHCPHEYHDLRLISEGAGELLKNMLLEEDNQ